MTESSEEHCPCGSGKLYPACCGPLLAGTAQAPTAEALMRSRYTAFCKGHIKYLLGTLHPTQRRPDDRSALAASIEAHRWAGLRILHRSRGGPADEAGTVEFVAYFERPQPGQIHERSRFVKEAGRWFYVDGESLPPVTPGRNEPCWCGSGKKYKRCHGG